MDRTAALADSIRRPDMPWSANEATPLPGCCAWIPVADMRGFLDRLSSRSAEWDGERAALVTEFMQALPSFVSARMKFVSASPATDVHLVMGCEIPDMYLDLVAACRTDAQDDLLLH